MIYIQNPNGTTESFYMVRLKDCFSKYGHLDYLQQGSIDVRRNYGFVRSKWVDTKAIMETTESKLEELTYKGFQIIVGTLTQKITKVYDLIGRTTNDDDEEILKSPHNYKLDEPFTNTQSFAWAYRIGGLHDTQAHLNWLDEGAIFGQTCVSDSTDKTIAKAKKILDKYAIAFDNLQTLNALSHESMQYNQVEKPFNVKVNDQIWLHAFGRYRKGLVIGTEGRRFAVAYTTPTSPQEPKYKLLNMQDMYVKHNEVIAGQEHNFMKVTSPQP